MLRGNDLLHALCDLGYRRSATAPCRPVRLNMRHQRSIWAMIQFLGVAWYPNGRDCALEHEY